MKFNGLFTDCTDDYHPKLFFNVMIQSWHPDSIQLLPEEMASVPFVTCFFLESLESSCASIQM